jgi:putative nucleotidyltransferase with HDIG domain
MQSYVANRRALTALLLIGVAITIGHFAIGIGSHPLHILHIVLGALYLLIIIAAALWFGLVGAVLSAATVTVVSLIYVHSLWRDQPMENANQFAMVSVYWVVAITTGALAKLRQAEMHRHLSAERAADRRAIVEAIAALSDALRARDEYTREHSEHVAALAAAIAHELGLSEERIESTRLAALVHDIGKIGVRDDVLLKAGQLSESERASIQQHPRVAANILRAIHSARDIAEIVVAHHECPDGSGYPRGLKGESIPAEARIVHVADVYASLVESRPYKEAMDTTSAMNHLSLGAGSKYDAECVQALKCVLRHTS